ncbi:MAG: hypothetical protein AB7Q97_00070 [Gammaproteobacteria bacterium]
MPTREQMLARFESHRRAFNARNRAEWLENFVDEPFIQEPADSDMRWGREQYGKTMDAVQSFGSDATIQPPLAAVCNGNDLALHLLIRTTTPGYPPELHIVEIFTFAEDGRIAGVRAFVPPEGLPPT